MGQDWIINVLSDLRSFARKNEMPLLMRQLDEAVVVASAEIAARPDSEQKWPSRETAHSGGIGNEP